MYHPPSSLALSDRHAAVARAEALAEKLAPVAAEGEKLRRMPSQFCAELLASGLMPLMRPARYGGAEADWSTLVECLMPLGRVSGSVAWCAAFLIQHQWVLGHFPIATQDEVYSKSPDPRIVTSFAPAGRAIRVDGGYRVTGEWAFGSGGDHCEWAMTSAVAPGRDGSPQPTWFLFKPGQFSIKDVWRSTGLKASGSNNIVVADAFVEHSYAVESASVRSSDHPGRGVSDSPLYKAGIGSQFQFALVAPLIATAFALYDDYVAFTRDKLNAFAAARNAENPLMQLRVGESAGELQAALVIFKAQNDRVLQNAASGDAASAAFLRDIGMIARLTQVASDRLFTLSGARGLAEQNLFGRHWRDVHAMCNHGALQADGMLQGFGAAELQEKCGSLLSRAALAA